MDGPRVTAIAPWYGSNRSCAAEVGKLLDGCKWVGVPFAGGMSELLHIKARTLLVSDLHRHVLNLADVVADPGLNRSLRERLECLPVHPDTLGAAQERCPQWAATRPTWPHLQWAVDYFTVAWMGRNGTAGTDAEFRTGLSVRWCDGGGDSAQRFRNATDSLAQWQQVMRRCTFVCLDVFDFLSRAPDRERHGLYLDPPFPGPGDDYTHTFDTPQQQRLAATLKTFGKSRVVVRFYDHPMIRHLYPETQWTWHHPKGGRTQANKAAPEVLLTNWRPE